MKVLALDGNLGLSIGTSGLGLERKVLTLALPSQGQDFSPRPRPRGCCMCMLCSHSMVSHDSLSFLV